MSLYDDVLKVVATDLGPSASAFLNRQIKAHLNKEPSALAKADLVVLADWVFIGVKLTLGEEVAKRVMTNVLKNA